MAALAPAAPRPPACAPPTCQIDYARGVNNTVAQFMAFQKALPTLDKRFGLTYGLSNAKFNLFVSGPAGRTWGRAALRATACCPPAGQAGERLAVGRKLSGAASLGNPA